MFPSPRQSFEPDTRLTDDRDPAVVVGLDDPTEPIRRNFHQLAADSLAVLLEGQGDFAAAAAVRARETEGLQ